MEKGEIWVSNFWDGRNGVIIGNRLEPNMWACTYLIKVNELEYALDTGNRVSSRIDPEAYYSEEGRIFEDMFSKFYHVVKGVKIVPKPEITVVTTSSSDKTNFSIFDCS